MFLLGALRPDVAVPLAVAGVLVSASVLRLYFWPFEAAWMLVLRLIVSGDRTGSFLHWLPIYYDEYIILPLPFLDCFLAEAYHYNQAGARQAIDYLTTHSRQQACSPRCAGLDCPPSADSVSEHG